MNKRAWLSIMALVLAVGLVTACGYKVNSTNENNSSTDDHSVQTEPVISNESPSTDQTGVNGEANAGISEPSKEPSSVNKKTETIKVYVSDDQLMELVTYSKEIQYTNTEEKLKSSLEALQNTDETKYIALWKNIKFNSYKLNEQGLLTIDVTLNDKGHHGAGGEALAIEALTNTLFQFDEVISINILVDGEEVESLMGHVTLEHPFMRP